MVDAKRMRLLAEARERGTHTEAEWEALVRNHSGTCRHCGVRLNAYNGTQDHIVALARGGSDAIDNLDYICWQCNQGKWAKGEEWTYGGPRPRPFCPHPLRLEMWQASLKARARFGLNRRG